MPRWLGAHSWAPCFSTHAGASRAASGKGCSRRLGHGRQTYAGYVVHLGFIALAVGITGSSLGNRRFEADMNEGEVLDWADRRIRYVKLEKRELPDKLVAEAVLEMVRGGQEPVTLRPARHLHLLQNEWTTEVAIHSTWGGDFYTILNAGLGEGKVALTFVENPMMRWIWCGGIVAALGALVAMWPSAGQRLKSSSFDAEKPGQRDVVAANGNPERRAA